MEALTIQFTVIIQPVLELNRRQKAMLEIEGFIEKKEFSTVTTLARGIYIRLPILVKAVKVTEEYQNHVTGQQLDEVATHITSLGRESHPKEHGIKVINSWCVTNYSKFFTLVLANITSLGIQFDCFKVL